jgi:S-DNA-T family DNA segregation ATPase FtsK/SpoIIIE
MQRAPEYDDEVVAQPVNLGGGSSSAGSVEDMDDTLYDEAVQLVIETGKASTSFLQRRFSIGYTRAARLIDMMEDKGVVAPAQGNKPRGVLLSAPDETYDQDSDNLAS